MPPFKKSLLDKPTEKEQPIIKPPVMSIKSITSTKTQKVDEMDDFSADLIRQINKEAGGRKAFNLSVDEAPTNIKKWTKTGSVQLDYILSNKAIGGLPEGRIIEIQGPASSGKSHIAYLACKNAQEAGGVAVYIDTENATSMENLQLLGVDVHKRFVFIQETCIEEIFKIIESTIEKARSLKSDIPVLVVWDSVAASTPKDELDGEYDKNTIGLAARVLSKGLRKITHVIGDKNVTLLLLNQQRTKIGTMYGDPCVSPKTNVLIRKKNHDTEKITLEEFAYSVGINDLDDPEIYNISDEGYEIQSSDEYGNIVWKPITNFVVKPNSDIHYQLNTLHGTHEHKVLFNDEYISLKDHPEAKLVHSPIQVVDITVEDTHNYIAEGQVNHNTTTPGGMAIPYHASVRIKLTGGQQIKKTIDGREAVIGISVTAKTIKNKVARPWREVDFEIHFGRGIKEGEQIFDALRLYCEKTGNKIVVNGNHVSVGGGGAWKELLITDPSTGEVVEEVKFYKTDFQQKILDDPKYKKYATALLEACYIMDTATDDHPTYSGVDLSSVDETTQLNIDANN